MSETYSPREIVRRLKRVHGPVQVPRQLDPLGELVFTILSQNTSDTNSQPAFAALVERFDDWEAVRKAPLRSIVATIRKAGLANQKAPRIKELLKQLHGERGRVTLDHLTEMEDAEARDYLESFHGVGRKTAACVLLFACGRPVLPVDTHVHRLSKRLGLISERTSADAAHDALQAQVTDRQVLDFHVLLIRHGRRVCAARRPRCSECVLLARCPTGQEFLTTAVASKSRRKQTPKTSRPVDTPHVPRRRR